MGLGVNNSVTTVMADGNGDVYVGGYFTTAGGVGSGRIARWDIAAQQWHVMDTGMGLPVFALTYGFGNERLGSRTDCG